MQFRFLSVFSTRVAFPRNQVLVSARRSSIGTDVVYLVFLFAFNKLARLRDEVGAKLRSFFIRREE